MASAGAALLFGRPAAAAAHARAAAAATLAAGPAPRGPGPPALRLFGAAAARRAAAGAAGAAEARWPSLAADPRLPRSRRPAGPPGGGWAGDQAALGWAAVFRGLVCMLRLGDFYTPRFQDLCMDRLTGCAPLLELFGIPAVQDKPFVQELHSKAVPDDGAYRRVRMQAYWLALHVWLLHSKQHQVQKDEGLFGSVLCAFITRRTFEWQWDRLRMFLQAADVPTMSVSSELQDLQEFIFGFCVALDEVFLCSARTPGLAAVEADAEDPAAAGAAAGQAGAGASDGARGDGARGGGAGEEGLAERVRQVLWANVYSGAVPREEPGLYELTVYLLRQRDMLEAMPRGRFLSGEFTWADHPAR